MDKDSIIIVYVPDKKNLLEQFFGLYYSVVHKTRLFEKFDFLIAGPPGVKHKLPSEHCMFVEVPELSKSDNFRYVYSKRPYEYINSFAPLLSEECVSHIKKYKYSFRIDVDTFLCPPIREIYPNKDEILVSRGGYASKESTLKLAEILKEKNLDNQKILNVGSTWYAESDVIISQSIRTIDFSEYLLKEKFAEHQGKWPKWYAGVTSMYAGYLAINSSNLKITRTHLLDFSSTSESKIDYPYSIHCWHTDKFFSKFAFMGTKYKGRVTKPESELCNEYAYDCAVNGKKMLNEIVKSA